MDAEIVPDITTPGTDLDALPKWVPAGKAAAILARRLELMDPDAKLSPHAQSIYRKGLSDRTYEAFEYQFLRYLVWCAEPGVQREAMPPTVQTIQEWIAAHWTMKYTSGEREGQLRGRHGQPYAPDTIRLSLTVIHRVWKQQNYSGQSPVKHPAVMQSMKGYGVEWGQKGFRKDIADSITMPELIAMVRVLDLNTVAGLRDAALLRLAAATGRRNSDLMSLDWKDLKWISPEELEVTIPFSKTNRDGRKRDIAIVEADNYLAPDIDALILIRELQELSGTFGFTSGPVFRQVRGGTRRKDGSLSGVMLVDRMTRKNYQDVVAMAAKKSGVDIDPVSKTARKVVPHSMRVLLATEGSAAGVPLGTLCDQGGWDRTSAVVLRYQRHTDRRGDKNPGTVIAKAAKPMPVPDEQRHVPRHFAATEPEQDTTE